MSILIYLLKYPKRITTNIKIAITSSTGFIIIKPMIKNKAINSMTFPIASIPDQSPLVAAAIERIMNNRIAVNMCILSPSFGL